MKEERLMPAILSDSDVGEAVRAVFGQREVARIYDTLKPLSNEENLRLVGGSVRDLYLGREQHDLDFATTLRPQEVLNALERAHIRVPKVDRAFSHGTVLAVLGKRQFEITTLRHDMQTDGRHAKVQFTREWEEDSKRRDFTVNALYGGHGGEIFDFHEGRAHMKARRLRFIGNARDRIDEDYLRVLRFFRFHAVLGWKVWDEDADEEEKEEKKKTIAACKTAAEAGRFEQLSGERLWQEFSRILGINDYEVRLAVLNAMGDSGVLQATLGKDIELFPYWEDLFSKYDKVKSGIPAELKEKMEAQNLTPPPQQEAVAHLAFFLISENAPDLAQKRFRLSQSEAGWLDRCHKSLDYTDRTKKPFTPPNTTGKAMWLNDLDKWLNDEWLNYLQSKYRGSRVELLSIALLEVRMQRTKMAYLTFPIVGKDSYEAFVRPALEWEYKLFPISGDDLKEMGLTEGKEMGNFKEEIRLWWLDDKERVPNREECLEKARELAREKGLL